MLLGAFLALHGMPALACGYCIEDRIAAVYDHAVVVEALDRKHRIAFFGLDGPIGAQDDKKLKRLAASIYGVDRDSVRVSAPSQSLSLSFNPKRISYTGLQKSLERKLSGEKLLLLPLRVMDEPAKLQTVQQ